MTIYQISSLVRRYNGETTMLREKMGLNIWASHFIRGVLSGGNFFDCENSTTTIFILAQQRGPNDQ